MSHPFDIRPGTVLGPYTLVREIGHGASAIVYAARDAAHREVALKIRRSGTHRARGTESEMDRRFLREFESMRLLRVKGVVRVHEAGVDGDILWYSMDLVDGRPFHEAFTGPIEARVARLRRLGADLLRILATLHEAGFVHRDIKPTNVLVDSDDQVSILDFGIGRYFGDQETLSHTGEVLGTVPYMAPEQVSGLPCDAQIDVFAAGLVLWEALAGKRPRPATPVGWIPRICMERLTPLCTLSPLVPRSFSAVVDGLLRVEPTERFTARHAANELAAAPEEEDCHEWPEPPFVDPGGWQAVEGVLGGGQSHPTIWILEGPAGTGRRRLAEQLQRLGLLQGIWTLHLHCRVHRTANPLRELLEHLTRILDDTVLARIVRSSGTAIRHAWPQLVLPKGPGEAADHGLTESLVEVVTQLARVRPALLVVHGLEELDPVTAGVLLALAERRPKDLGLLLVHDPRWSTVESRELVERMVTTHGAGCHRTGPVPARIASAAARGIAPKSTLTVERPLTFAEAMVQGWSALARWRNESFVTPDPALHCLVTGPAALPPDVFEDVVGSSGSYVGAKVTEEGVSVDGATMAMLLRATLADRARVAAVVATVMERTANNRPMVSGELARAWLLAGAPDRAWAPAARAAVYEELFERYVAAREWLWLLDTLPRGQRDPNEDFELTWVHGRVALHTDADDRGERMFAHIERSAQTEDQDSRVRLLRAEFDLRAGQVRSALVTALRIASAGVTNPHVQVQALLVAFRCRVVSRQIPEAQRDLERAESVLVEHPQPVLSVRVSNARAEVALLQDDLLWCRALCQKNIRVASQTRHLHALAEASFRLGSVLRMLGRRREAEAQIRTAADAALATGDLRIRTDAGLALAALLCERGEALAARVLLDETIRRIRVLSLEHLLPTALRVALQIATLTGNATDGNVALASLRESPQADPESAADLVQWWRTNGDLTRAVAVPAPVASDQSYGWMRWQAELARAWMVAGDDAQASARARAVAERSAELGFADLEIIARLVDGVAGTVDDAAWSALQERAVGSMWCDVFLGAIEMDARRLGRVDPSLAEGRWRALLWRARELGHRPGVEEATGWLGSD